MEVAFRGLDGRLSDRTYRPCPRTSERRRDSPGAACPAHLAANDDPAEPPSGDRRTGTDASDDRFVGAKPTHCQSA